MNLSKDLSLPSVPLSEGLRFLVFTAEDKRCFQALFPAEAIDYIENATLTEGHVLCSVATLSENLEKIEDHYRYQLHHDVFVTVMKSDGESVRQKDIEQQMYAQGYHLNGYEWFNRDYQSLKDDRTFITTTFKKVRQTGHKLTVMQNLLAERDLHMDMLREFSCRSDAHVFRYVFAHQYIRPNDRVLDCACGLGYGSYLLSTNDHVASVTAVDICPDSVAYANGVYGNDRLDYQVLDIDEYQSTDFKLFDLITSFETIEHVTDFHSFFKLCLKSLKPDGRLIASVPYLWVDETGKDPNPYHFHEFDWHKFASLLSDYGFILEARYHQTAPGGFKLTSAPRRFEQISLDSKEVDTEWLVIVATPNLSSPLWQNHKNTEYVNSQYPQAALPIYVDFASGYDNPWLHRQLVQVGQRIEDNKVRADYVAQLLATSSDDRLMLKTVQGYALESSSEGFINQWILDAESLLENTSNHDLAQNPFVLRWYVSLSFLIAKRLFDAGNLAASACHFGRILTLNCSDFCPVLCIKAIESDYYLAKICLYSQNPKNARQHLISGKNRVFAATEVFRQEVAGEHDQIAPFLWSEMAELYDAGALLNQLLIAIDNTKSVANIFTKAEKLENNKRFGLFNLVQKYRSSPDLTYQADMQLLAQSYINKLISKVSNCSSVDNLYIWGTGVAAKQVCKQLTTKHIKVVGFIDSNATQGQSCMDKPVITPADIQATQIGLIVLTSVGSSDKIAADIPKHIQCVYVA
ncbi:class I SAM-dependent methyltransferase [Aliiglaciecola sp. LCG003]|uniref:class I SAM-dependent methyltransferase n=1 Tax=Aliiglaciecola sp. LCG003 TaxID=3053655 RepID=UPI002572ADE4|nr:class I SAM-dependent methyltransferase [Aliiglaciecola sp. LCG003]WJG10583.1 class I SAM-dependent methyltransferase [Aliiglaciecola sp. LCG003]